MDDNKHWGWKNKHGSLCICVVLDFEAICNLLDFSKDDDATATFFLALEDLCFSPAACFVKVLCTCFHKCKILCFPSANDASFLLQRFCVSYELLAWHPLCFHKFFVFHLSTLLLSCLEDLCFSWAACFASFPLLQVLNFFVFHLPMLLLSCFEEMCFISWAACLASSFMLSQVAKFFAFSSGNAAIVLPGKILFLTSFLLGILHAFTIYKVLVFHLPMLVLSLLRTSYVSHRLLVWGILHVVTKFVKFLFDSHLVLIFFHMEQQSTLSGM